jgi:uncharacterized protein (DUF2344 family)
MFLVRQVEIAQRKLNSINACLQQAERQIVLIKTSTVDLHQEPPALADHHVEDMTKKLVQTITDLEAKVKKVFTSSTNRL